MNSRWYLLPTALLFFTRAFTVPAAINAAEPSANATPGPNDPSPQTRTFYIEGVHSDADVKAIIDAVLKVKSVTKVDGLTASSGFANISFDHHAVTHQQIAQAIADAGSGPDGHSFKASFRLAIPDYTANADKIDAIFAKSKDEVTIDWTNKEKGEFTLHSLPLKPGEAGPHGIGFNFGKFWHPVSDPPPKGLGLKFATINPTAAK